MTDHDYGPDRIGQPVAAHHADSWCAGCGTRILVGELIVQHEGCWVHAPDLDAAGSCVDAFDDRLRDVAA